jgi:hypothetical protein
MITAKEKLECARRELVMRKRVYPKWVADGRMTKAQADRQIEVMTAIAEDYAQQVEPKLC